MVSQEGLETRAETKGSFSFGTRYNAMIALMCVLDFRLDDVEWKDARFPSAGATHQRYLGSACPNTPGAVSSARFPAAEDIPDLARWREVVISLLELAPTREITEHVSCRLLHE